MNVHKSIKHKAEMKLKYNDYMEHLGRNITLITFPLQLSERFINNLE